MDYCSNTLNRVRVVKENQLYQKSLSLKREDTLLLYIVFIHEKGVDMLKVEKSKAN